MAEFILPTVAVKICTKCLESKPFSAYRQEKRTKIGLHSRCKSCESAYAKTPEVLERARTRGEAIRAKPERKAYMKEYAKQPHVYQKSLAASKARYIAFPERVRATNDAWRFANKERKLEINAAWNMRNKPRKAANLAIYRANKLNATPPWADVEAIKLIYELAAKSGMHVDHVIPLRGRNVCGLHVQGNLQLLTPLENMAKGNKWSDNS